jgi:hypothetical protein
MATVHTCDNCGSKLPENYILISATWLEEDDDRPEKTWDMCGWGCASTFTTSVEADSFRA